MYSESIKRNKYLVLNFAEIVATSKQSHGGRKKIEWINVDFNDIDSSGDRADDNNEGNQNKSIDNVPDEGDGVKLNVKLVKDIFITFVPIKCKAI